MKTAFIFAGQGAQYVQMQKDFYDNYAVAKSIFDNAKMDYDIKKVIFEGPKEVLNDTLYTQPCVFLASMSIYATLKSLGIDADIVAGLSLGEYSALCAAYVFDVQTGLEIIKIRSQLMSKALSCYDSKMAAIMNADIQQIKDVIKECSTLGSLSIANYNSPTQIVITGESIAVDSAVDKLRNMPKVKAIPLKVSGAFHSPLLKEASNDFTAYLQNYDLKLPKKTIYYNICGEPIDVNDISSLALIMGKQMSHSVYFMQTIENMIKDGVELFVEIGPGSTLSKLISKIAPASKVINVDSIEDIAKLQEVLANEQ